MPKGQPKSSDLGLDNTPTWGRTYWGGAAFWLLADTMIYEQTSSRRTLQDAMRAVNRESGGNIADWTVDHVMAVGDAATETDVLSHLYRDMKAKPVEVDLQGLFEKIGVKEVDGKITFDDRAPLARFRQNLTRTVS
jgi:predicted metalloprotease with PDZ domain